VDRLTLGRGGAILLACGDKAIREFNVAVTGRLSRPGAEAEAPLMMATGEFRNPVEGGHGWRAVAITADGEHVLGAWGSADAHCIFVWARLGRRQLTRILEGAGSPDDRGVKLGVAIPGNSRHGIQGVNTGGFSCMWLRCVWCGKRGVISASVEAWRVFTHAFLMLPHGGAETPRPGSGPQAPRRARPTWRGTRAAARWPACATRAPSCCGRTCTPSAGARSRPASGSCATTRRAPGPALCSCSDVQQRALDTETSSAAAARSSEQRRACECSLLVEAGSLPGSPYLPRKATRRHAEATPQQLRVRASPMIGKRAHAV